MMKTHLLNNTINKKSLITSASILMIIMASIATSTMVNAKGHSFRDKGFSLSDRHIHVLTKRLSLTDKQVEELVQIKAKHTVSNIKNSDTRQDFFKKRQALIHAKNFDENKFLALQARQHAQMSKVMLNKAKAEHKFYNLLTKEQKEKLATMKNNKGKRFK